MDELVVPVAPATRGSDAVRGLVVVVGPGWADLVDEHLARPADPGPVALEADALLELEQRVEAAALLGRRDVVRQPARGRAGSRRERGREDPSKRTVRSSSSVSSNWASVSPQKPTMMSVVSAMPGTAARSRSTRSR